MYDGVTFLYSRNLRKSVNQLYFNKKFFLNEEHSPRPDPE